MPRFLLSPFLNGKLTEVSKHQLFALAERGEIGPETRIVVSGKESTARKVKGIEFGTESFSEPPAGQDLLAQYRQKFYGDVQPAIETKEEKPAIPVSPTVADQEIKTSGSKTQKNKNHYHYGSRHRSFACLLHSGILRLCER